MPRAIKYFVLSTGGGNNFTDFGLSFDAISTAGESVAFVGSGDEAVIDAVFSRPGVTIDFTTSNVGSDRIYFGGNFSDYSLSRSASRITVERGSGAGLEKVSFARATDAQGGAPASDLLIFADGSRNAYDVAGVLSSQNPTTPATSLPPIAIGAEKSGSLASLSPIAGVVKAFAVGTEGSTFAPPSPGMSLIYVGSDFVDTVYVSDGATVDATQLGVDTDRIYLRGNWSDYAKTVSGSVITFTRTVDGRAETVKVSGVLSPTDERGALDDQLFFADGSVSSGQARKALRVSDGGSLTAPIDAVAGVQKNVTTPGLGLSVLPNPLDDVTNLDVSSNIVLAFSEDVTAVADKFVRIINTGGLGFRTENTVNDLIIPVLSDQVTISNGKVTVNPRQELDFANTYHVLIDQGAFVGKDSGRATAAFDGTSSLNFRTVTPGVASPFLPSATDAVVSSRMDANGTMQTARRWLDIEGVGNAVQQRTLDISSADVTLVAKDYNPAGGTSRSDGIATGEFNVKVTGFGDGDQLYIDNQSVAANDISKLILIDQGTGVTTIQFSGLVGQTGGFVDLSFKTYTGGAESAADIKARLELNYDPIVSDDIGTAPSDTAPPVILTKSPILVAEGPSTAAATLTANEPVTWSLSGVDSAAFSLSLNQLSFKTAPNFEQLGRSPSYQLTLTATDSAGNSTSNPVVVTVSDVNESPVAVGTIGTQTVSVNTDFSLSIAGRFADPDSNGTANGTLSYAVVGSMPTWLKLEGGTFSGTPTAAAPPVTITVKATDGGSPALAATQSFSLVVASEVVVTGFTVSDNVGSPTAGKAGDPLTFVVQISEAVTVSTASGTPSATFSIGNTTTVAQYQSGSGTSQLIFTGQAPAGVSGSFQLTGLSLNNGTIVGSGARALTTSVVGQNFSGYSVDNVAPAITVSTPIKVNENSTSVATLTASEPNVTWALGASGDASLFQLASGSLSFKTNQDFEQTTRSNSYSVPLSATDNAGNVTNRTVTVELQDVNEFKVSSVTDRDSAANFVVENSPVGTPVAVTALARDLDGTNNKVTYKLVNSDGTADYAGGEFRIDSTSGVVSVAGLVDYEAGATRTLRIRALSSDGSQTSSPDNSSNTDLIATINIGDVVESVAAQPLILSSAPVISPTTTAIAGKTGAGLWVKAFVGTGNLTTASTAVQADSSGNWSMPASALSGLAVGSNPVKFVATSTQTSATPVAELVQSLLYSGPASWTQEALKNPLIRGTVDQALASDGKITHAEAVSIIDAAISAAKTAMPTNTKVGATILADLRTLSTRGDSVFTSPDLTGKESGYLSYVFDKVVNTSGANAFFTGGTTTQTALGNLNADSPVASLEKLRDKWLLGKDLPDPRTQGDTANPKAVAASGTYKAFSGVLVAADGFNLTDVQQGNAGTCYLLAAAAFVAETQTYSKTLGANASSVLKPYQTALDQVFTSNAGASPTWGVRFFDQYGKANWVTVNDQLVVKNPTDTTALYSKPAKTASGPSELWVPLIEKAYAQANEMGIFGRAKSENAYFAIEGGLAEPVASLIGGGVSIYDATNQLYKPNFFVTGEPVVANRLANFTAKMNSGESLFLASFVKAPGEKDTFVSGHAYIAYDNARTTANNTTTNIYNPWGPSNENSGWVSPFTSDLDYLTKDPGMLLAFHSPTIPKWSTDAWAANAAKKAASSAPVPVASQLRDASSSPSSNATVGEIPSAATFLTVGSGIASAFSDNGSANTADDRQGVYTLSGTEAGTRIVYLEKTAQSGNADLNALKDAIVGATSAEAFHTAVQNALSGNVEVRFGLKLSGSVDITGDTRPETGVTVALKYPFAGGALPSNASTITFAPLKDAGEIESAKNASGAAVGVRDTMLSSVGHAVSFDKVTGAVLYLDPRGHWMAGQVDKPVFSEAGGYSEFYKYLTYDADGDPTPDKINNDSLEVSAQHIQLITSGASIVGYELLVKSNENPDDFFVMYFDGSGSLVSSEYLSDIEILEAEVEYGFDVNGSGAVAYLEGDNFVSQDVFLAEGVGTAPDLYADAYGDLVLINSSNDRLPIKYQSAPLNTYDFDEEIEPSAVMIDPSNPQQYLLFILGSDDELAAVKIGAATGEIVLVNGEIDFADISPALEAELERLSGLDLGRDGDTTALSPLITGDASDNFFNTIGDGTGDRFKDSSGDDIYFSGEGDDLLLGILSGEPNFGSRGANTFFGGEGNDRMAGLGDGDVFFGGDGDKDAVWINGASTAYQILPATAGQLAFAQEVAAGFGEEVPSGGHAIREIASGAVSFVWDVEIVEFALDGVIGPLQQVPSL